MKKKNKVTATTNFQNKFQKYVCLRFIKVSIVWFTMKINRAKKRKHKMYREIRF